jgi:hypothetical protein
MNEHIMIAIGKSLFKAASLEKDLSDKLFSRFGILFEPFKIIKEDLTEEPVDAEHPIYGKFKYNEWYACASSELLFVDYQITPINNNIQSCIIKNVKTNKILCTKSNNNYDPSINIVHNKKSYGLLLSHLLLIQLIYYIKII